MLYLVRICEDKSELGHSTDYRAMLIAIYYGD